MSASPGVGTLATVAPCKREHSINTEWLAYPKSPLLLLEMNLECAGLKSIN